METVGIFNALDDLGVDVAGYAQFLVVALLLAGGFVFFRMNRKRLAAQNSAVSSLSSRLAEVDPADYDFDGNRKVDAAPSVDFDGFFSNASRREELGGAPSDTTPEFVPPAMAEIDVPLPKAPSPTMADMSPAQTTVFAVPDIEDLPSPDPQEPTISREAYERLTAISSAAEERAEADATYVLTEEEKFASAALEASLFCAEGLPFFITKEPDLPRFRGIEEVARTVGAADLETVVGLQIRLMELTSNPEWRDRDPDDPRWQPVQETCHQLMDLFRTANRSGSGVGRMTTLADAYLAGEW